MQKLNVNAFKKYNVISFDIFDTLVCRAVKRPIDVFRIVEIKMQNKFLNNGFMAKRVAAEKEARLHHVGEITLQDIYSQIDYLEEQKKIFLEEELSTEIAVCYPNWEVVKLYNQLHAMGKEIFLISDMYLPREVIERILHKCGIFGYKKLLLSCEERVRKAELLLFKNYVQNEKINCKQAVHIGDNFLADIISAKLVSLNCFHINNKNMWDRFLDVDKDVYWSISNGVSRKIINEDKDYFYNLGAVYYGPLLFSFCVWLDLMLQKEKINKVYFCARDGYIIKQAFELITDNRYQNFYLYVSRKSVFASRLAGDYSIENVLKKLHLREKFTLSQVLERMDIVVDDEVSNAIQLERMIDVSKLMTEEYKKIIGTYAEHRLKEYEQESTYFEEYIYQMFDPNDKHAVIDVGWNGTTQKAIDEVLGNNTMGYYLGINQEGKSEDIKAEGYLYGRNDSETNRRKIKSIMGLLEIFLSAPHNATKTYCKEGDRIVPVFEKERDNMSEYYAIMKQMHMGALNYVKEILLLFRDLQIPLYPFCTLDDMHRINKLVTYSDLEKIGNINFSEGSVRCVARPGKILSYIKKPQKFVLDYGDSIWKIGFIKRLFKNIPFPYESIYNYLIKIYKK